MSNVSVLSAINEVPILNEESACASFATADARWRWHALRPFQELRPLQANDGPKAGRLHVYEKVPRLKTGAAIGQAGSSVRVRLGRRSARACNGHRPAP